MLSSTISSGHTVIIHKGGPLRNATLTGTVASGEAGDQFGGNILVDGASVIHGGTFIGGASISMQGPASIDGDVQIGSNATVHFSSYGTLSGSVNNFGTVSGGTIETGGMISVATFGSTRDTNISSGPMQIVLSGGTSVNANIVSSGLRQAEQNGMISGSVENEGTIAGGYFSSAEVSNKMNGELKGNIATDGIITHFGLIKGGTLFRSNTIPLLNSGGSVSDLRIESGGQVSIQNDGLISNVTLSG